jgi:hypothetical protein
MCSRCIREPSSLRAAGLMTLLILLALGETWASAETPIKQRQIRLAAALMLSPGATTDQLPSTVDGFGPIGTCEARHYSRV